jgi:hypothetical protein
MKYPGLILLTLIAANGSNAASKFRCDASVPAPAYLRPNGFTELLADIVLACDGDAPAKGIAADIDLFFSTQTYGSGTTGAPLILAGDGVAGWRIGDNVFAGERVLNNQVHWSQVTLASPGLARQVSLRLRFTNLRINATPFGGIGPPGLIQAYVEIQGVEVTHPAPMVGVLAPLSALSVMGCDGTTFNPSLLQTRPTNIGLLDGSGIGENIQVIIHAVESFESAFKPLSTESNHASSFAESPSEGLLLAGIPGLRKPDSGTRFVANFNNIPEGVSIFVTTEPMIAGTYRSDSIDARLVGFDARGQAPWKDIAPSAVARCGDVSLGVVRVPLENGGGSAVWEVTSADPNVLEEISFGIAIAFRAGPTGLPGPGAATVNLAVGPVATSFVNSPSLPIPRFEPDSSAARNLFRISRPVSRVIFPLVANIAGFDTQISVTNTSAFGSGECVLTFASLRGSEAPAPPQSIDRMAPGATQSVDISKLTPGIEACAIAECFFSSVRAQYRVFPLAGGPDFLTGPALDPAAIPKSVIDDLSAKTQGFIAQCPYLAPEAGRH